MLKLTPDNYSFSTKASTWSTEEDMAVTVRPFGRASIFLGRSVAKFLILLASRSPAPKTPGSQVRSPVSAQNLSPSPSPSPFLQVPVDSSSCLLKAAAFQHAQEGGPLLTETGRCRRCRKLPEEHGQNESLEEFRQKAKALGQSSAVMGFNVNDLYSSFN